MTRFAPLIAILGGSVLATGAVAQTAATPVHHPAGKMNTHHARAATPTTCDQPALFVPAGKINTYAPATTERCATNVAAADRHGAGGSKRLPD